MMSNWPLLSILTFTPLAGALLIILLQGISERIGEQIRGIAFLTTMITFVLSIIVFRQYDPSAMGAQFQLVENFVLIPTLGISYHLGIDAIALSLILLTTFLMPIAILASGKVTKWLREYMVAFLLLETMMIGTFCALDTMLFYIFFESVLIPMFLIIGIWGGPRRVYASFKFFLYTLLGSVMMLLAVIVVFIKTGTTNMEFLLDGHAIGFNPHTQTWLWLAFFASFAVKMPMWPVHTWLPDAHVEAPTAGSIILAGILLKMGGYGFLRFSLPMLPDASAYFVPLVWGMSLMAIVYVSLVALVQTDMKRMIAYSSVAHSMGFTSLALFTFNVYGLQSAMLQMISHGLVSGALFLCIGILYDRMHTREIAAYGGVANKMPKFTALFMFMMLASVGVPGTSGFVAEFLGLLATFKAPNTAPSAIYADVFAWGQTAAVIATTGIVFTAAYMLWLFRRVMFGEVANAEVAELKDLNHHELIALVSIAVVVLWLGIDSDRLIQFLTPSLDHVYAQMNGLPLCSARSIPLQ